MYLQVLAGVSLLVSWTIIYHHWKVIKQWRRGLAIGGIVMAVGVSPFAVTEYNTVQETRHLRSEFKTAQEVFAPAYPDGTLETLAKVDDAWVYTYTNDGQQHVALRLGGQWFNIGDATPPEGGVENAPVE